MLKVDDTKHEFRENDECPFCNGALNKAGEEFRCSESDCWFNKVTWEKDKI